MRVIPRTVTVTSPHKVGKYKFDSQNNPLCVKDWIPPVLGSNPQGSKGIIHVTQFRPYLDSDSTYYRSCITDPRRGQRCGS